MTKNESVQLMKRYNEILIDSVIKSFEASNDDICFSQLIVLFNKTANDQSVGSMILDVASNELGLHDKFLTDYRNFAEEVEISRDSGLTGLKQNINKLFEN